MRCPSCSCRRFPFEDCTSCKNPNNAPSVCSTVASGAVSRVCKHSKEVWGRGNGEEKAKRQIWRKTKGGREVVDVDEEEGAEGKQTSTKESKRQSEVEVDVYKKRGRTTNQGQLHERKNLALCNSKIYVGCKMST